MNGTITVTSEKGVDSCYYDCANPNDAVYFPTSMDVIVCRVVPTISANSPWESLFAFRSSLILFFTGAPPSCIYSNPLIYFFIILHSA